MRITILTYGSRGDVQPFLALALGLQKAGHQVKLAAPHRFDRFVQQHNVPFVPLTGDPEVISQRLNNAGINPIGIAAGLRHGIPNIVVSFAAGQPFWGARIHAIGAGPKAIPVRKLTEEKLIAALVEADGEAIRSGAQAAGLKIRDENGVAVAVKLIEDFAIKWRKSQQVGFSYGFLTKNRPICLDKIEKIPIISLCQYERSNSPKEDH